MGFTSSLIKIMGHAYSLDLLLISIQTTIIIQIEQIIPIPKAPPSNPEVTSVPNREARKFIESKQGTHNWDNHNNFKQDSIPLGLEEYFTSL